MRYDSSNRWDDPQKSDISNIMHQTSFEYPTLLHSNIGSDGLQQTHRGIIGISKTIHVLSGCQLTLKTNANIQLLNQAKLIVDAGATLIIEANDTIIATNPQNQIIVNGNISIGEGVVFTSQNNLQWLGLALNNPVLSLSLQNVDFGHCIVTGCPASFTLDNCDFSNGGIDVIRGNIYISGGMFAGSFARVSYALSGNSFVNIEDCQFANTGNNNAAIIIESYPAYSISGCTISGCIGNGISISNSGSSANENHLITDNIITGNGTSSITAAGLYIYHSYADVTDNVVFSQNPYGIQCLNNSEISITGNRLAEYDYQTQQIRDNAVNQVYATRGSFPREVKWNAIVDEDNDYATLKSYYLTIDENEILEKLAGQLATFCDVALENWQPAIESFEGFIEYPSSYEDSLFAIIDLAHTYILMEQSAYKSVFTGKLSQYRYNSTVEFDQSKDYHISLLFGESDTSLNPSPQDQSEPAGRIIGNQPNPFSGTTQISFALHEDADINIYLINELGQKVEIVQQSNVSKGLHRIYFSSHEYKNGMYVCVLEMNKQIIASHKVMILN